MREVNLSNVQESTEFEKVIPGGYVCVIKTAADVPEKEYLELTYDIAEGSLKGHYADEFFSDKAYAHRFFRSYKESALPFFKGFVTAVEESNRGYKWSNDERTLVNKAVGLVIAEEEYKGSDGTVKTRLYVAKCTSVDKIRKKDFTVPELKRLSGNTQQSQPAQQNQAVIGDISSFEEILTDDGCPF